MRLADTWFIILDTETTGLERTDEVIEVAAWQVDARQQRRWGRFSSFVLPTKPIPPFISGLTGITNIDVLGAPDRSYVDAALRKFVPADAIIVAHNAAFDSAMLDTMENGLGEHQWLCTKRMAQHLLPNLSDHKLQTLRYHFDPMGCEVNMEGLNPHRAEADVAVLKFVFRNLLAFYESTQREAHDDGDIWHSEDLLAFVNAPIIFKALPFGKHQGVALENVDPSYLRWLLRDGKPDADIRASVERVLAAPAARGPF